MLKRLRNYFIIKRIKHSFAKGSLTDPGTVFLPGAVCRNSGRPENLTIGPHCVIGGQFVCNCGGSIEVEGNAFIQTNTFLWAKERIVIKKNAIISNNVIISDNNNHPTDPDMRLKMSECNDYFNDELWSWKYSESAPITIGENTWIGRDTRILKGVTIGTGSIVAMGSVVTHDVPDYCIVAGNPAKVVKKLRSEEKE